MKRTAYLLTKRDTIAKHLHTVLKEYIHINTDKPYLNPTVDKVLSFAEQGKLIRGSLVLLSNEMYGGIESAEVLNAAVGMELTHTGYLIHDDIIDRDLLRRGNKTLYAQYQETAREQEWEDSEFYGVSMGICAGDITFALAAELIHKSCTDLNILHRLSSLYFIETNRVHGAQMLDFHMGYEKSEPTAEEILHMYRNKSARYTFSLPFLIGAILARANDEEQTRLDQLGELLGIVFQLKDDSIEVFGSEQDIGKEVGSDFRENKKTYLRSLLYGRLNTADKDIFESITHKSVITDADINRILNLLKDYSIEEEVNSIMNTYTAQATDLVKKLQVKESFKRILTDLAEYNLKRTA